jgi:hypothetical protein
LYLFFWCSISYYKLGVSLFVLKNFIKKGFTNGFIRYIMMNMNKSYTNCPPVVPAKQKSGKRRINSSFQAAVSLSLLLLRLAAQ